MRRACGIPKTIRYELEYAYAQAISGRPGPVLLELPLDVQGADIDPDVLPGYTPIMDLPRRCLANDASIVLSEIRNAQRPILVCGNGVYRAKAQELLRAVLERLQIPFVLPITCKDLLEEDHPMQMGIFGIAGQRRANFAVQNSDLMLAIGAGLNCQKVGFNIGGFAPKAKKIIVDIDEAQLEYQLVRPDIPVQADAADFLREVLAQLGGESYAAPSRWLDACARWRERYPPLTPDYSEDRDFVNTYYFYDRLSEILEPGALMVTGNALDTTSHFQAFRVKRTAHNQQWLGRYGVVPADGDWCVHRLRQRQTVCSTGDGSFQFNSQELLTMAHYRLPIQIFVINNQGYSNIRGTQNSFFEGRFAGATPLPA